MANNSAQDIIEEVAIERMAPQVRREVTTKQKRQKVLRKLQNREREFQASRDRERMIRSLKEQKFDRTRGGKVLKKVDTRIQRAVSSTGQPKWKGAGGLQRGVLAVGGALGLPGGQAISTKGEKKSGRGRGRPSGTYKTRILPDGTPVKVPTSVYKKMVSAQRTQRRLQQALIQARLAQTPPPDHVRGGDQGFDDDGIAEQLAAQQFNERQQMPQRMPRRSSGVGAAAMGALGALGRRGQEMMTPRQQMYPGMQQPQGGMMPGQMPGQIPGPSRVSAWGDSRNNILNSPNVFNNPGQTEIGIRR